MIAPFAKQCANVPGGSIVVQLCTIVTGTCANLQSCKIVSLSLPPEYASVNGFHLLYACINLIA